VEIVDLAEQFPAGVKHRLDLFVAQSGGDFGTIGERLVRAPAEFHIEGDAVFGHGFGGVSGLIGTCGWAAWMKGLGFAVIDWKLIIAPFQKKDVLWSNITFRDKRAQLTTAKNIPIWQIP